MECCNATTRQVWSEGQQEAHTTSLQFDSLTATTVPHLFTPLLPLLREVRAEVSVKKSSEATAGAEN